METVANTESPGPVKENPWKKYQVSRLRNTLVAIFTAMTLQSSVRPPEHPPLPPASKQGLVLQVPLPDSMRTAAIVSNPNTPKSGIPSPPSTPTPSPEGGVISAPEDPDWQPVPEPPDMPDLPDRSCEIGLNSEQTAVIDLFGDLRGEAINSFFKEKYPDESRTVSEIIREMGVSDITSNTSKDGLMSAIPKDEREAYALLLMGLANAYSNHGDNVRGVKNRMDEYIFRTPTGPDKKPNLSLIDALQLKGIKYDEYGNPTLTAEVSQEKIEKIISSFPGKVVNMSFQIRQFQITYKYRGEVRVHPEIDPETLPTSSEMIIRDADGNKIVSTTKWYKGFTNEEITGEEEIAKARQMIKEFEEKKVDVLPPENRDYLTMDGYAGEDAYNNLLNIIKIAKKFPDKIFIAAAGNPSAMSELGFPFLTKARDKFEAAQEWPANLFLVGTSVGNDDSEWRGALVGAADYNINFDDQKRKIGVQGPASSFATPAVSSVVENLVTCGMTDPDIIKKYLDSVSNFLGGSSKDYYKELDFSKVREKFPEVSSAQPENSRMFMPYQKPPIVKPPQVNQPHIRNIGIR